MAAAAVISVKDMMITRLARGATVPVAHIRRVYIRLADWARWFYKKSEKVKRDSVFQLYRHKPCMTAAEYDYNCSKNMRKVNPVE